MRITQKALTFDDVLLLPAHSNVLPRDVCLRTQLTRNITLNIPLLSAAMDTVTEARLAIALAQEGGIGIVHKNMTSKGAGGASCQGQAFRKRRGERSDHDRAKHDRARRAQSDPSAQDIRFAGAGRQESRRHRDQPRSAFREQSGPVHHQYHDAARPVDRGQRERQPRRSAQPDAQAPYRTRAGGERCVRAVRA